MMVGKYIMVVLVLAFMTGVQGLLKTGALRMCDQDDCELSLRLSSSQYKLRIYKTHLVANNYFVLCFRERVVTNIDDNNCQLGGLLNSYTCGSIVPILDAAATDGVSGATVNSWTYGPALTGSPSSKIAYMGNVAILDTQIEINFNTILGITSVTDISTAANKPKIYEVYVGYTDALQTETRTKNAFFHTFRIASQTDSDDLFMQRHPVCLLYFYQNYYNYNLVFYGGVVRSNNETMFFHVLSYLQAVDGSFPATVNLNAWIGVSLSSSHAGRDMFAFITANSTIMDLFSLFYHSPYLDLSPNVDGTFDLQAVGDSTTYTKGATTYYYWGGMQRLYTTGDFSGDQIIRQKINNTYCLAIAYSSLNNSFPFSPILSTNIHDNYGCWTSTIQLSALHLALSLLGIGMLVLAL